MITHHQPLILSLSCRFFFLGVSHQLPELGRIQCRNQVCLSETRNGPPSHSTHPCPTPDTCVTHNTGLLTFNSTCVIMKSPSNIYLDNNLLFQFALYGHWLTMHKIKKLLKYTVQIFKVYYLHLRTMIYMY